MEKPRTYFWCISTPRSLCTLITLIPVLNTLLPAHIRRLFAMATTGCPVLSGESATITRGCGRLRLFPRIRPRANVNHFDSNGIYYRVFIITTDNRRHSGYKYVNGKKQKDKNDGRGILGSLCARDILNDRVNLHLIVVIVDKEMCSWKLHG